MIGDVARDFLAILDHLVVEGIAAVGRAEDGAATRQDAADVFEFKLARFLRPDQTVEAVRNANDFPLILEDRSFDRGTDDGIEARGIAASGANADAADVRHGGRLSR